MRWQIRKWNLCDCSWTSLLSLFWPIDNKRYLTVKTALLTFKPLINLCLHTFLRDVQDKHKVSSASQTLGMCYFWILSSVLNTQKRERETLHWTMKPLGTMQHNFGMRIFLYNLFRWINLSATSAELYTLGYNFNTERREVPNCLTTELL